LRHRPDRIIVAEVRDGAAYDLFEALKSEIADAIQYVAYMERRGARRELTELIQVTGFDSHSGNWELLPISGIPTCE
jgi:Flp pilus assembly CpaF family ATPase